MSHARAVGLALKAQIQNFLQQQEDSLLISEEIPPLKSQEDSPLFPSTTVAEFTPLTVPPWHHRVRAQKTLPDLRKARQVVVAGECS